MLPPCLALLCTVSDPNFENSSCLLVVPQVVPKRFCGVLDTLEEFRYTRKGRGHKYCCGAGSNTLWDASVIKIPVRFACCERRWGRISPQAWGTPRGHVHLAEVSIPNSRNHHNYNFYHMLCASVHFPGTFVSSTNLLYGS